MIPIQLLYLHIYSSLNKKLALHIQSRYQDQTEIVISPIEKLPICNQDDEQNPPFICKKIKEEIWRYKKVIELLL